MNILCVSDKYEKYAEKFLNYWKITKFAASSTTETRPLERKIRESELQKYPYMIIIGEKEVSESKVSVRQQGGKDHGAMSLDNFVQLVEKTIEEEVKEFKL